MKISEVKFEINMHSYNLPIHGREKVVLGDKYYAADSVLQIE